MRLAKVSCRNEHTGKGCGTVHYVRTSANRKIPFETKDRRCKPCKEKDLNRDRSSTVLESLALNQLDEGSNPSGPTIS